MPETDIPSMTLTPWPIEKLINYQLGEPARKRQGRMMDTGPKVERQDQGQAQSKEKRL